LNAALQRVSISIIRYNLCARGYGYTVSIHKLKRVTLIPIAMAVVEARDAACERRAPRPRPLSRATDWRYPQQESGPLLPLSAPTPDRNYQERSGRRSQK